jgi:class 3 adenylate cyclase
MNRLGAPHPRPLQVIAIALGDFASRVRVLTLLKDVWKQSALRFSVRGLNVASRSWDKDAASARIDSRISELPLSTIQIKEFVRDTDLTNLPRNLAYRIDGVHLYADILNLVDLLHVTDIEGETCHRRTLRFLNLHYRAVHRILQRVDAIFVDFHNQRLHAVITKPYESESERVRRAVAIGQLIIDVLSRTGEDADHPAAKVRVGIDSGLALAVNNGRRGHREPLFLGEPANRAAKRAGGGRSAGIFLTSEARALIGLRKTENEDTTPLTTQEVNVCKQNALLETTPEEIVKEWEDDLRKNPIGSFQFTSHTPPFATLDIEELSVKNSRRQDAVTVYADLDGFTSYVARNITTDTASKHVVRTLHVLRSELDAVLHVDFAGRKVRFVGDCVHGLEVEGTAQTTDQQETISNMVLCAGALRSSFGLALTKLKDKGTDATSLGLAIGFEYGPMNATRLGMKGELVRCSVSRGVLTAEVEQKRCTGNETAIGSVAYQKGTDAVRAVFGPGRKRSNLSYAIAVEELAAKSDRAGKAAKALASGALLRPPTTASTGFSFPNRPTGPSKPAGFA